MTAPVFREDNEVYPLALELASCLCAEITNSGLPETCVCTVYPGGEVPRDFCSGCDGGCGGQAWVRVGLIAPSKSFPVPDSFNATCASPLMVEFEVGIIRCAPLPDAQGNPPDEQALLDSFRGQMADMQAMRRAILCCSKTSGKDHVLGTYSPIGPEGGCIGGLWSTAISVL